MKRALLFLLCAVMSVQIFSTVDISAELFPTLAGLQRTGCTKTIGENENGIVWGSRSYLMQEIETDTIDGKQYLLFGINDIYSYDEYCSLWLREENNKILVYSTAQKKDLVLYDFTLNVGDSLSRLYVDYELSSVVDYDNDEWGLAPLVVTEVSTITLLDGKDYKKWTFDNGMEYVEGIGSFGTCYAHNDFYQLIANAPLYSNVHSQHLVCVSKNGKLLYQMDDAEMEQLETECLCEYNAEQKPKDLFPTLWGLQQTICSGYYGEEGDEWASGLTGPSQEITMMDGKPYLQWGSWYLREENDKILVYSEIQKKDLVLYDFTLELGDTLTTLNLVTPEFLEYEGIVGIVDYPLSDYDYTYPIDTLVVTELSKETLLDGKEYTRWKFSDGTVYVEGIGSMSETFFHHIADHLPVPVSYLGSYLVCVSKNGKLLYQMDDVEMERLGTECLCEVETSYKDQWCDQWNVLSHGYRPDMPLYGANTMMYQLEEDTTINQHTYIKLVYSYTNNSTTENWYSGALRFTEDKKVYIYYDNAEYLLYDFNVQVGDTLDVFAGVEYYNFHNIYPHIVTNVVTLDDGRLQVYLDAIVRDEYLNQEEKFPKTWIEGVGSIDGIVHNNAILGVGGNGKSLLLCAYHNNECRYTTENPEYTPLGCVYNEGDVINAVESVSVSAPSVQKIIKDGQLLILRDGKTYNIMGVEVGK